MNQPPWLTEAFANDVRLGTLGKIMAARYGVDQRTIRKWKAKLREHEEYKGIIPVSDKPRLDTPPTIYGESAIILADAHVPYHDAELLDLALKFIEAWNIEIAIIPGDLMDQAAFSPWIPDPYDQFSEEVVAASHILQAVGRRVKEVIYLKGNHEARLERLVHRQIDMQLLVKMLGAPDNCIASSYKWCIFNDDWVIGHPHNYSQVRGSTAQRMSDKYQLNVLLAHEHHWSTSVNRSAKQITANVGCLADIRRLAYLQKDLRTNPVHVPGFAIIHKVGERNFLYNFAKEFTDFESELRRFNGNQTRPA